MDARRGKQIKKHLQAFTQIFKITMTGIIVFSIVFTLNNLNLSDYFPIKTVSVYGLNRLNQQEVKAVLFPLVEKGFFTVNVESIRNRLLQMPWVSDLYVRRVWPDHVIVTLTEKKPVSLWN